MKRPRVTILASKPYGTLTIGVTGNLADRVSACRKGLLEGFTKRYRVHRLVYYELHRTMEEAIRREKQLKDWKRA